jgi:hypothetical protein
MGALAGVRTVYITATRILVLGYFNGNTYTVSPFQIAVTLNAGETLTHVVGAGRSMAVLTSQGRILSWSSDNNCNTDVSCHIGRSFTGMTVRVCLCVLRPVQPASSVVLVFRPRPRFR